MPSINTNSIKSPSPASYPSMPSSKYYMLYDRQRCPCPKRHEPARLPPSLDPIKHRKCHETFCLSLLLVIFYSPSLFSPDFRDRFPPCRTPCHVFEKPVTCPMEQPAAQIEYYTRPGALSVDLVPAKPVESRLSPRRGRVRPVAVRKGHTAPAVWSSTRPGQHPCLSCSVGCVLRLRRSQTSSAACRAIVGQGYLLGSLGESSPLLPWLSVEDGLPSLLSFPSFPQHFTSLCLCEHKVGQQMACTVAMTIPGLVSQKVSRSTLPSAYLQCIFPGERLLTPITREWLHCPVYPLVPLEVMVSRKCRRALVALMRLVRLPLL